MKKKKPLVGRKLKNVASQPQEKVIPSSSSSARPGIQSAPQRVETPSGIPLPLMALFKAMVPMSNDHNIVIPVEDATFGLPIGNMYVSKDDVFQLSRMEKISSTCIVVYMK